MPYEGGSLAPLFGRGPVERAAANIADNGGNHLKREVQRRTPVETGHLRESWGRHPTVGANRTHHLGQRAYKVEVSTSVAYAPSVEHGTGIWGPRGTPYPIPRAGTMPPGRWMRFRGKAGEWVYRKAVMHPGSRGRHMMAVATNTVQHEVPAIAGPVLRAWAEEQAHLHR